MQLRPYQSDLKAGVEGVWADDGVPLGVMPTGAGKTVVMARILHEHDGPAVAIAHRRELVGQISLALAKEGVVHRIVAPMSTIRMINRRNLEEIGRHCYDANASIAVASVDSIRNSPDVWSRNVSLWVMDEAHHVLRDNKWGKAIDRFPNAKGLGVTATPERADGKGLGRHAEGLFTHIVNGPPMRELMDLGFLTEYRIYAPPSSLDVDTIRVSQSTGDYMVKEMQAAVRQAQITGDVVEHYLRLGRGKLGVTFAVSVAEAEVLAAAYNQAGVPAAVVTAKTPDAERADLIRRFRNRELMQLVNVDIFGEGFDLPAIEVVSFVRPTMSFPLYCQSFGRALRPMPGKDYAIIIDHVSNVVRHGPPDAFRIHSLDSMDRRSMGPEADAMLRVCLGCARVYQRIRVSCPYCGVAPVAAQRSSPNQVDGDLVELHPDTLELLRAAVVQVDRPSDEYARELFQRHCPAAGIARNVRIHEERQAAQARLRHVIAWWRGVKHAEGLSERECYRLFFLTYGIDVLSAHALDAKDANDLANRIRDVLPFAAQCMSV